MTIRKAAALILAILAFGYGMTAVAAPDDPQIPSPLLAPKVAAIVSPLATVPAIVSDGSSMTIELDAGRVTAPATATASLRASFGAARISIPLPVTSVASSVPSDVWRGERTVHSLSVTVPSLGGPVVEDLYDLHVEWPGGADRQPRAVSIVDEHPAKPRFVVIADPSVGDPRAIQEGVEDLQAYGPDPLIENTNGTIGDPPFENRWKAFVKTIEEVNLIRPDFVLITGDLNFGVYPEAVNAEYEESYRLVNTIEVPTFLTPGNHDLYHFDYDRSARPSTTDGLKLWQLYYGPVYYSVDAGPALHIVSFNTYDWPDGDRPPFVVPGDGSTRSGGTIRAAQFDWIANDLRSYRATHPNAAIVTFAHHDPSWMQRRHPWPGLNRLELRELMAETRVGAHFSGHTHDDRVARYHQGNVVETNGNNSFPKKELHYIRSNDTLDSSWSQADLAAIVRDPSHGPVFVTTTTAASGLKGPDWGLGSYWGWRYGVLDLKNGGYDPNDFGYPATEAFLNATAKRPQNYNAAHAPLGVFSYPSFHLDRVVTGPNDGTTAGAAIAITSRLLIAVPVVVRLSVAAAGVGDVTVTGGTVLRSRSMSGVTDLWVALTVPAGGSATSAAS